MPPTQRSGDVWRPSERGEDERFSLGQRAFNAYDDECCPCVGKCEDLPQSQHLPICRALPLAARSLPTPPQTPDTFGGRVRARRRELNFTQRFVGQTLERSQVWVSHVESGRHDPNVRDLAKLATLLQVTTDWLIYG